ncbi:MAG: hypothetical protein IJN05_08635 [Ruminococcus sp.]|nr:hypothetical protein [Ruminococcus sp.]
MLLLLLKKIIQYGDIDTINNIDYSITEEDYKKIIQLQLIVAEELDKKHSKKIDVNHFLYSTYHFNSNKNVAHEFLRMYYMLERLSQNRTAFDDDVQNEYKDYYTDFSNKYGFTPTQYSSLLFGELNMYYSEIRGLTKSSIWRDTNDIYEKTKVKDIIPFVIDTLSKPVEWYCKWTNESEEYEWDFSKFYEFPFIKDNSGKYISICDITLTNAFFEKLFWLIRDCYPKEDDNAMAFFGRLFEKYIQDITEAATGGKYQYIKEFTYKIRKDLKKSSDAYIRKDTELLVIEAKGFSVLFNCMARNESVEKNNKKIFIDPVLQADICLFNVIDNKPDFSGVNNAYIISVTMDNINAVPNYYNNIHKTIDNEKKCDKTKYYYNFNIEEYEMLLYLIEKNYDIFAILKDYYNCQKLKPFSNFLLEIYPDISMTSFMKNIYKEAAEEMKKIVFGNES